MGRKIIIDVDTGVDDAMALMMVLENTKDDEVVAVTCVAGNSKLDSVLKNTLQTLVVCNRPEVPVYPGCVKPLVGEVPANSHVHGADGLGNLENRKPVDESSIQKEHASLAMIRLAKQYSGEITMLCLAPLTNLATAQKLDATVGNNIKDLVIMGGNSRGRGNRTACAEFNFFADPEAAKIVLNEVACMKTIVCLDLCREQEFSYEWMEEWYSGPGEKAEFVKNINRNLIIHYKNIHLTKYRTYDPVASAVMLDKAVVLDSENYYTTVECAGENTRGMLIIDVDGQYEKPPNTCLITKINYNRFKEMMEGIVRQ